MLNTNQTTQSKTYRIVNGRGTVIDDLTGLTLNQAETCLCRCLNQGANAYLQDELTPLEEWQGRTLSEDEIRSLIGVGFCQPKFYKRSVWLKAKKLMDEIVVPLGLAYPHDYGYGKGKYSSDCDIDEVKSQVVELLTANNGEVSA
ncbi:MAG: hypothetical protein CML21_00555 [Rheinheimera sp.]|nr:hypothetical protein [Rheinheimera sp.]|tara:strand:+ start:1106 stop:1540 length:435 start_codon:yes stop_codon:yes gene_type:complete